MPLISLCFSPDECSTSLARNRVVRKSDVCACGTLTSSPLARVIHLATTISPAVISTCCSRSGVRAWAAASASATVAGSWRTRTGDEGRRRLRVRDIVQMSRSGALLLQGWPPSAADQIRGCHHWTMRLAGTATTERRPVLAQRTNLRPICRSYRTDAPPRPARRFWL